MIDDLDETDIEILKILSKDSTTSMKNIADQVKKHPTTITNHVNELKEKGIIKNSTITIDYEKLGYDIIAIIELTISKGKMLEVELDIAKIPNVFAVYDITGQYDALVLTRCKDRRGLSELVKTINSYEYVIRTNTHLILNMIKETADFEELIEKNPKNDNGSV
ncbi:MAG: putative HTH-type transcriptional regulator [Promethearchaeota archaeon]|nr:MAG: putative HTH-type transcriptional regulator [Candidatus Lokiarchaeota archaeon]